MVYPAVDSRRYGDGSERAANVRIESFRPTEGRRYCSSVSRGDGGVDSLKLATGVLNRLTVNRDWNKDGASSPGGPNQFDASWRTMHRLEDRNDYRRWSRGTSGCGGSRAGCNRGPPGEAVRVTFCWLFADDVAHVTHVHNFPGQMNGIVTRVIRCSPRAFS
jgi:hypothetical protein